MRPLDYMLVLGNPEGQLQLTKEVLGMTEIWNVWESYYGGDAGTRWRLACDID
jgi:hypothetical protein